MHSGSGRANRQLYDATCDALRALWDADNPALGTDTVYAHLEQAGHITRPQPLAPTLTRLEREGLLALEGGYLDREGAALHGAWNITRVDKRLLGK